MSRLILLFHKMRGMLSPVLGSNLISKTIRNDDPDAQLNTSFRVAAVKISV